MGKTIGLPADMELTVTGVFMDIPESAHLQFDVLVNLYAVEIFDITIDRWSNSAYYTYVQLNPEADPYQDFLLAGIIALILVQSTLFFVSIKTARKAAVACLQHG